METSLDNLRPIKIKSKQQLKKEQAEQENTPSIKDETDIPLSPFNSAICKIRQTHNELNNTNIDDFKSRKQLANVLIDAEIELVNLSKQEYKTELLIKSRQPVPKWRKQLKINKSLGKGRFEDIWAYIWKNTIPLPDAVKLCEQYHIPDHVRMVKGKNKEKDKKKEIKSRYVLFQPNIEHMAIELNLSKPSIHKYISAIADAIPLVKLVNHSGKKSAIYGVGYYASYFDKKNNEMRDNRIPLLRNTYEIKEKLRDFKLK
jgi:hypothetical protein